MANLFSEAMSIAVEQMIYERNRGASPAEIIDRYRPHTSLAIVATATWDNAAFVVAHAWMALGSARTRAA